MIQIAVCDDDFYATGRVEQLILETQCSFSEKLEVSMFYSGESFVTAVQDGCPFDIILMDIEMKEMSGIEAGEVLRAQDENDGVQLIFISSHEQYHQQLFDVQPSGFLKKPLEPQLFKDKLTPMIQKAIRKRQQGHKSFLPVQQKGKEVLLPFRHIMYLESNIRKVLLHSKNEQIEYYSTLNEEERKLPVREFIRIHQSYLVNFYYIKEIRTRKVVMVTGIELPISEKNIASVKKRYLKFRGELAGIE